METITKAQLDNLIKKAEAGLEAEYTLGLTYYNGAADGVPKDDEKAATWWQKAANQGHAHAQSFLARLYQEGWGVRKDNVTAYMWFSLAYTNGVKGADNEREKLRQDENMTDTQIKEAEKRCKDCLDRGYKQYPFNR